MLLLIVDKPGLTIRIAGMKEIRTPVRIDITKVNINNVLSALKRDGIYDFQIIEDGLSKKKPVKRQKIIEEKVNNQEVNVDKVLDDFKKNSLESKLDTIEFLIRNILNSPSKETVTYKDRIIEPKFKETKEEDDFDDPEFIPEIKIGKMQSKKPKLGTIKRDDDLDTIVNTLRNMNRRAND